MYSFELTDYQKEIRDKARKFAQEELLKMYLKEIELKSTI